MLVIISHTMTIVVAVVVTFDSLVQNFVKSAQYGTCNLMPLSTWDQSFLKSGQYGTCNLMPLSTWDLNHRGFEIANCWMWCLWWFAQMESRRRKAAYVKLVIIIMIIILLLRMLNCMVMRKKYSVFKCDHTHNISIEFCHLGPILPP